MTDVLKPKRGVLGELGLGDGDQGALGLTGAAHVVDAADGEPAGVGEGGNQDHAVGLLSADLGNGGRDDVRLQRVVAAEGGVAAADETQSKTGTGPGVGRPCRGEGVADHFLVAGRRFGRVEAAGVGQDVDSRLCPAQKPRRSLQRPTG